MHTKDYRDIIGGGIIILLGLFIAAYALNTLAIGTPRRMGPGFFPIGIGVLLVCFGIGIAVPAFFREGTMEQIEWRPLFAISASLLAFGLCVTPFGLVPAIAALVAVSALADSKLTIPAVLGLIASLSLICYVIFDLGLGLTLPMLRWPF
ncbi:tripartite tricarboxylate transporter TctB family protein [Mangrovicella endophytica]|uniref:tripartite tricarboxylate transporter TctB family protein n=1 Tax=Mangrovicella endophytica TaxID=2066697 RepID=UPI000C9EB4D7|nr:tripartite tricarboxylate transporter TctB family protein [Mangrovicella endophytica]